MKKILPLAALTALALAGCQTATGVTIVPVLRCDTGFAEGTRHCSIEIQPGIPTPSQVIVPTEPPAPEPPA